MDDLKNKQVHPGGKDYRDERDLWRYRISRTLPVVLGWLSYFSLLNTLQVRPLSAEVRLVFDFFLTPMPWLLGFWTVIAVILTFGASIIRTDTLKRLEQCQDDE